MRLPIAVILVHRFTTLRNRAQITALRNLLEIREEPVLDENGDPFLDDEGNAVMRRWYAFSALPQDHEVKVYQVIPMGVTPPPNLYLLDSHKVFYGPDQPSHERRFLNWGLKRATDYGAEWVLFIRNHAQFTPAVPVRDLSFPGWGLALGKRVQERLGSGRREVVREALSDWTGAIADFRDRAIAEGLEVE